MVLKKLNVIAATLALFLCVGEALAAETWVGRSSFPEVRLANGSTRHMGGAGRIYQPGSSVTELIINFDSTLYGFHIEVETTAADPNYLSQDTVIDVYVNGAWQVFDDDAGGNYFSRVHFRPLSNMYKLRVRHYSYGSAIDGVSIRWTLH
ncbi:MAG: hypothetical protein QNJ97_15340 [Myxococcota bacterium]|nr:hypothetical protein [Myxococcota bacterium]